MGMNFYLLRKINFINNEQTPASLGCSYADESFVTELENGLVWGNTYYPSTEELNKVFYQRIHIGKSSMGWHFGLCIYPDQNINSLDDWIKLFRAHGNTIVDEEDRELKTSEMLDRIEDRKQLDFEKYESEQDYEKAVVENYNNINKTINIFKYKIYNSYDEILMDNHACRGLNGLWRRQKDQYTSYPIPDGTYDLIISGNDIEKCCIFS